MRSDPSFTVEVVRGNTVESAHQIHAVISDSSGRLQAWGWRERPTIARSAIKSIQAIPLVTSGAADALSVSEEELALACASHSGEPEHIEAVLGWLTRIGLSEADLECGPDTPIDPQALEQLYASRSQPSAILNCCSGKHAGFLSLARHLGVPTGGYIDPGHEVQRRVTAAVETMTGAALADQQPGIDGCGIPVFAISLQRLAYAMARLVDPVDLIGDLPSTTERVVSAASRSFWVSGTDRTEMEISEVATEAVVTKGGAEGVFMAGLPERGLGIAIKATDGRSRASRYAIKALLRHLDVMPQLDDDGQPIHNKAGDVSGQIRAVLSSPEHAVI
ncbi:MAG: asparaginase [Actinomycetia bacterium]|nr:asparaginase [Actinomycetes bacterium]